MVRQDGENHETIVVASPGYSVVWLPVLADDGENLRSASQRVKWNVAFEISKYYEFVQKRNRHMRQWWALNAQISQLVDQAKKPAPRWGRKYGRHWRHNVENVSLDLAYLKVEIEDSVRGVERDLAEISLGVTYFSDYTQKAIQDLREFQIQDMVAVVKTLEERSKLQQINAAVIVAGIIGGAAGLIAGFLSAAIALYTAGPGKGSM
jgi:hypothetical protein